MSQEQHPWSPVCPRPRLVRPVPVDPAGELGPTLNQARGPRWRRTGRGLYVPSTVSDDLPEQRVLERAAAAPRAVVSGWAALRLASAGFFDGRDGDGRTRLPVDLVHAPGQCRRARPGVRWSQDRLGEEEVWTRYGIRCSRPLRALFDTMRWAGSVREAVVALDMAAAAELVSVSRLGRYLESRPGWAGVGDARRALALADEHSRSPAETRLRLVWQLDARLPRPLANRDVFSPGGRLLGVADLIDPVAGVVGEYDGADHARARRRSRDAARDSAFRDHGLEVFRVTGFDEHQPELLVARVRAAYARAARSDRQRDWTLTAPDHWPVALDLDDLVQHKAELHRMQEAGSVPSGAS